MLGARLWQGSGRRAINRCDRAFDKGEQHLSLAGQVGFRFFGEFILDCLNRTEKAMSQAHAFKAAELCLKAQAAARVIAP